MLNDKKKSKNSRNRDRAASYNGIEAEMAVRLNMEVGQVELSKSGLRGPPPGGQDFLEGVPAALVSPRGREAAYLMGMSRRWIVVGRFDGPDDPACHRITRWGPVTPNETEEALALLKAPGKAEVGS